MKAMLSCRMLRTSARHSAGIAVGSSAVERRLHPAAKALQRAAPGLIRRLVEIRAHHLGQSHRAVADGFQQLIDDRHRGRFERCLSGPIEDEAAAGAAEQAEDDRDACVRMFCWNTLPASP